MKCCPRCKSRATKIVSASDGSVRCQICNHKWELADFADQAAKALREKFASPWPEEDEVKREGEREYNR